MSQDAVSSMMGCVWRWKISSAKDTDTTSDFTLAAGHLYLFVWTRYLATGYGFVTVSAQSNLTMWQPSSTTAGFPDIMSQGDSYSGKLVVKSHGTSYQVYINIFEFVPH
jgi:hypothetical protein